MKKKSWKLLLLCGIIVGGLLQMIVNLNIKNSNLTMENIEALADNTEAKSNGDCIEAAGRCTVEYQAEPLVGMTLAD